MRRFYKRCMDDKSRRTERMASIIYDKIKKDILVICGIHINNATKEEIDILVNNAQKCVDIFLRETND